MSLEDSKNDLLLDLLEEKKDEESFKQLAKIMGKKVKYLKAKFEIQKFENQLELEFLRINSDSMDELTYYIHAQAAFERLNLDS